MIKNHNEIKIVSGGIYLVNLGKHKNPEFSSPHYCVVLKTHDKDLLMCLPTTSQNKKELYSYKIPEDNSVCLFKHSKFISKKRILKPLCNKNTGDQIIVCNMNLELLLDEYKHFLEFTFTNALRGNYHFFQSINTNFEKNT